MPILPPSFHGDAVLYGFAIFGTMLMTSLAIAGIVQLIFEARTHPDDWRNPISMHRLGVGLILLSVVIHVGPDVGYMLWYGETGAPFIEAVALVDRICDAIAVIPFLAGMACFLLAGHAITFQLIRRPLPVDIWSSMPLLVKPLKIAALCFAVAVCVAFAK